MGTQQISNENKTTTTTEHNNPTTNFSQSPCALIQSVDQTLFKKNCYFIVPKGLVWFGLVWFDDDDHDHLAVIMCGQDLTCWKKDGSTHKHIFK
jgi:hypothetical protein